MSDHEALGASTTDGLPVAPSLGPGLAAEHVRPRATGIDRRVVRLAGLALLVGLGSALMAQGLTALIGLVTNLSFYGRWSPAFVSPAGNRLGWFVALVPAAGGLVVGLIARYGSEAIRGHGIPEAMEQVLRNESRIPGRLTFLKPLSAAVAIGTGGPFGAEGPIIAGGGALGSLVGQLRICTAHERKTLLAAGAAAGMAATFGTPVSAVLLAVELLLFEYRARSLIPVALAAVVATAMRTVFVGPISAFAMPVVGPTPSLALIAYAALGAVLGAAATLVTRLVYRIEDAFCSLPLHWMWWPALGAIPVGVIGFFAPRTLGVGYENIRGLLAGDLATTTAAALCVLKLASWSIALGSGTSGGTLAPLFTIGGALGSLFGAAAGLDPRVAALVGMAALFAGASRALLASVVFAVETTGRMEGVLPVLLGCAAAYLVSALTMRSSIMTERLARRGHAPPDWA